MKSRIHTTITIRIVLALLLILIPDLIQGRQLIPASIQNRQQAPNSMQGRQHDWEEYWEALINMESDGMTDGNGEESSWETVYDMLCDLDGRRINLNTATREELEQLPFLTARQVEDICEHLYFHKGMRSIGELLMIKSLDYNRRKLLEHFSYVGEKESDTALPSLKDIVEHGRHTLTAMGKVPLYERKGDKNGYLGYPYKHWLRYDFRYSDRIRVGLVASQDAGEPFFSAGNEQGYDYYSAYFQMKNTGRISNLIIGRYRPSFGMGLVVNPGFSMGKQSTLASLARPSNTFRPHSSRSIDGYMQGAAATVKFGDNLRGSVFASYRAIDATLNNDGKTIATILSDGYHRTPSEMTKKNNAHSTTAGANIEYRKGTLLLGATAIYTHFDLDLQPRETPSYRKYYAAGNDFVNMGLHYSVRFGETMVNGEVAVNRDGYVAAINSTSFRPFEDVEAVLLHRYYSHRYTALHAMSFSDNGKTNNEHGIYGGMTWRLSRKWQVTAYGDFAYFYWPKYQASQSSRSFDAMTTATYRPSEEWTLSAQYRLRLRERDSEDKSRLITKSDHRARLTASYSSASGWSSKSQLSLSLTDFRNCDRGIMAGQTVKYAGRKIQVSADIKYFHTDSYDARLYMYEPGLPYQFYFPAYYGHGIRYSITAGTDITKHLTATLKGGTTEYFDRATISSGLREIDASSMTDVEMQIRWKF